MIEIQAPWVDFNIRKPPINQEVWFCDYDGVTLSFRGHLNSDGITIANESGVITTILGGSIIAWMPIPPLNDKDNVQSN